MVGLTLAKFGIDYALFAIVSTNRDTPSARAIRSPSRSFPAWGFFALASLGLFSPPAPACLRSPCFPTRSPPSSCGVQRQARVLHRRRSATCSTIPCSSRSGPSWRGTDRVPDAGNRALRADQPRPAGLVRVPVRPLRARRAPGDAGREGLDRRAGRAQSRRFPLRPDPPRPAPLPRRGVVARARRSSTRTCSSRGFPELATGVLVLAGTVFFPAHHLYAHRDEGDRRNVRTYLALALATGVARHSRRTRRAPRVCRAGIARGGWCAPFVVQIPLILLANLATYSMQSQGHLPGLLRNLLSPQRGGEARSPLRQSMPNRRSCLRGSSRCNWRCSSRWHSPRHGASPSRSSGPAMFGKNLSSFLFVPELLRAGRLDDRLWAVCHAPHRLAAEQRSRHPDLPGRSGVSPLPPCCSFPPTRMCSRTLGDKVPPARRQDAPRQPVVPVGDRRFGCFTCRVRRARPLPARDPRDLFEGVGGLVDTLFGESYLIRQAET